MEALLAKIGFKVKALMAATVAALALSCGQEMEVETFELERLDASEAAALIGPYVFEEREGAPGEVSVAPGVLTVRELPENLERITQVLDRFDRAASQVRLRVRIIEANGFTDQDAAIQDVEAELRDLLRYDGYRLVGESVMNVIEAQGYTEQRIWPVADDMEGFYFTLNAHVARVTNSDRGQEALIHVGLMDPWNDLFETTITVQDDKTMVIGTTAFTSAGAAAGERRIGRTLILAVTAEID